MSALTISAVDHTTGQLTVTAHGQVTGAGPAAVYAAPGGVLPTGVAGVTDFFLIVVDANTVKLATSSTNALAGTALTFSTNGTLPLQLLIGLPYRRPMTAAAGGQIKSANDNSTWDTLVAMFNLLTGQAQSVWSRAMRTRNVPISMPGNGNVEPDITSAGIFSVYVPLDVGDKIVNLRALIKDSATGPTTIKAQIATGATFGNATPGAATTLVAVAGGTSPASSGAGTVQTLTASAINYTVVASTMTMAEIIFASGSASFHVYAIEVDYIPGP